MISIGCRATSERSACPLSPENENDETFMRRATQSTVLEMGQVLPLHKYLLRILLRELSVVLSPGSFSRRLCCCQTYGSGKNEYSRCVFVTGAPDLRLFPILGVNRTTTMYRVKPQKSHRIVLFPSGSASCRTRNVSSPGRFSTVTTWFTIHP